MSGHKLVFYTSRICPYAQRVAITLKEVGAQYESVEIDLTNKPSWYKDVNPDTKVPALSIDGKNLAESLVLVELVSDLYPEKKLLPTDPIKRAEVRFFIECFSSKLVPSYYAYLRNFNDEGRQQFIEGVSAAYKRLNELLLAQAPSGPYFLGQDFSVADIAVAPFAARLAMFQRDYMNGYKFDIVKESPRLAEFLTAIQERPSFKETYCGDEENSRLLSTRWGVQRSSL